MLVIVRRTLAAAAYYSVLRWLPSSTMPLGNLWKGLRTLAARRMLDNCSENVNVEHGAYFGDGRGIHLGAGSGIGVNCRLHGPVRIGSDVMMGPDVVVLAVSHGMSPSSTMRVQGRLPTRPVVIGDDVWIGTRAILLPGVCVGDHSIIGAGAVVTKNVEAWTVVAGNPARVVRRRRDQD